MSVRRERWLLDRGGGRGLLRCGGFRDMFVGPLSIKYKSLEYIVCVGIELNMIGEEDGRTEEIGFDARIVAHVSADGG